jgi:hypothetical protein
VTKFGELTRAHVHRGAPMVTMPHVHSAFPLIAEGY